MKFNISIPSGDIDDALMHKINGKTKPPGSLGKLESLALQIGRIQSSLTPTIQRPVIAVFAGDHGITAEEAVSPYPQDVTYQMVMNFLNGGAAINVLAEEAGIDLRVIDAGVNYNFGELPGLIDAKVAMGTSGYMSGPAMEPSQLEECFKKGTAIVDALHSEGSNFIGFGEMGIGNSSSAALLMHAIAKIPLEDCIGMGTSEDPTHLNNKFNILSQVIKKQYIETDDPVNILATYGGFEIAQMCAGMLRAAELGMVIAVDGFISTSAYLVAHAIDPNIAHYSIFAHNSNEKGHRAMLDFLGATALVDLKMRLGEGSGVAVAYPVIRSACAFINKMASFEDAGVTDKS